MLRALVAEELTILALVHENIFVMPEILGPGFAACARDALLTAPGPARRWFTRFVVTVDFRR